MGVSSTGEIPVVRVTPRHISPEFFQKLDEDYGRALEENGGHVTYTIRFDGERVPRFWDKLLRFLGLGRHNN